MKKGWFIGCMLLLVCSSYAQITGVHAVDSRFVYVGRTLKDSTSVAVDWTGSYVRVRFWGNYLALRLTDTGTDYYNLYLDRPMTADPDRVLTLSGDTTVVLFSARRRAVHDLILYKRTEGEQGRTIFREFLVQGEILPAEPLKPRQIEFIGDSYTCGYGAENSTQHDHFTPQTETSAKTYAAIIARYFDADYTLIAHSGMGIARNYNSKFAGWYMPDRYEQTLDMDSAQATRWQVTHSDFRPQMTVIFLGGNDFSTGQQPTYEDFERNYNRLLNQIKANYGADHPVLCCTKKGRDDIFAYVQRVVQNCGLTNVSYCPLFNGLFHDDERNLGADNHLNYEAHRKVAHVLIPYVATMTGWELQDRSALVGIQ